MDHRSSNCAGRQPEASFFAKLFPNRPKSRGGEGSGRLRKCLPPRYPQGSTSSRRRNSATRTSPLEIAARHRKPLELKQAEGAQDCAPTRKRGESGLGFESIVKRSQAVCGTYATRRLDDRLGLFCAEFLSLEIKGLKLFRFSDHRLLLSVGV
jgi:hypothetical protein